MAPTKKHFYGVAKGRITGIFIEWSLCEESIYKFINAVHKGFININDAIHFLMASEVFDWCCQIPVHIDKETPKFVKDYEHECTAEADLENSIDEESADLTNGDETIPKQVDLDTTVIEVETEAINHMNCTFCHIKQQLTLFSVVHVAHGVIMNVHYYCLTNFSCIKLQVESTLASNVLIYQIRRCYRL